MARPRRESAGSALFPRWVTIFFVIIIGLVLWIGVLSDPSGHPAMPGMDSVLYVAGVIFVAAILAFADRKRGARRTRQKDR